MGMNVEHGGEDELIVEINTTPLIDVMLVLLIMLIITIPIQTHAVRLDMPVNTSPPSQAKPTVINIDITTTGKLMWNDQEIDQLALDERFKNESLKQPQSELHIRTDRTASYKYLAGVLASAQRNGMTKLGIVGNEQFM